MDRSRGLGSESLQVGRHELVEIAIHDSLYVGHLEFGAMIVHHGIGLKDIGADLIPPRVVGLGRLAQRLGPFLLLDLSLI